MSSRHEDIFSFDSTNSEASHTNENQLNHSIEIGNINLTAETCEKLISPLNYQTARRIEHAKTILRDRSLLTLHSLQTGESICRIRAKLFSKLSPSWSPEIENKIFNPSEFDEVSFVSDYTIVTPSNTFIEIDNVRSFASSLSAVNNSYKSPYSMGSFKSPDRMKFNKM